MAHHDADTPYNQARWELESRRLQTDVAGFPTSNDIAQQKIQEDYRAELLKKQLPSVEIWHDPRVDELTEDVRELKETVYQLAEKIVYLEERTEEEELLIREISYEQAKEEIAQYFVDHDGENIDPADIQGALGIDIMLAIAVCKDLEQEGKIKGI